jgi:hypothetical protein
VQAALGAIRLNDDGSMVKPASVNTFVAAVNPFLGFAHCVGYTHFNVAPLIKLKKAPPGGSRSTFSASWRFAT